MSLDMAHHPVAVLELVIPVADVQRMTEQHRFSYYLLGHMFNELNCLQKLVAFAMPKHDDVRSARVQPEVSQALFLLRLCCGKIWEAHGRINNSVEVVATLRELVFPKMPKGPDRQRELNKAIGAAPWLSKLRNGIGFHFPTFKDWEPLIKPDETWVPDSIFIAEMTGNTFYAASDSIAQAWMFGLHGAADIKFGAEQMIEQMIDLLRLFNSFLEDVIGILVTEVVLSDPKLPSTVGEVPSPEFESVAIPFWTTMPPSTS